MIEDLLKQIQKTNPDMTAEKLISEIRYSDYLTTALMISKELPVKKKTAIIANKKEFQYGNNRNKW